MDTVYIVAHSFTQILYPIRSTQIGKGHMTNINFQSHAQTNFTFPIKLAYDAKYDPTGDVLADILKHCGVGEQSGTAASPVTLTYNIDVRRVVHLYHSGVLSCSFLDRHSNIVDSYQAHDHEYNAVYMSSARPISKLRHHAPTVSFELTSNGW